MTGPRTRVAAANFCAASASSYLKYKLLGSRLRFCPHHAFAHNSIKAVRHKLTDDGPEAWVTKWYMLLQPPPLGGTAADIP